MIIDEAIKNLKKLKSFHNGSYGTAINMAIKALEQQCEEENPNCTECRYYDHKKHHCPRFCRVIENTMAEVTSEQKTITYKDCANAMLMMWMDNVVTDGEYSRIMDKLNKHREDSE